MGFFICAFGRYGFEVFLLLSSSVLRFLILFPPLKVS